MTGPGGGRPGTTRERILSILRRRGSAGVSDLVEEMGLAGATVRRHLDVLLRDGHVALEQVRGRTGRPRYVFRLTELGAELFPHHYVRLTRRLVDEIVSLARDETEGLDGAALAALVFERMCDRLAREYALRIRPGTLEQRARQAVDLLSEEGLDFDVIPAPVDDGGADRVRIIGRGCPCRRLAAAPGTGDGQDSGGCAHDRRLFEQLLGAHVEPVAAAGGSHDFLVDYDLTEGE